MNPQTTVIKPGMHLFHENDRSRELYIIQSGSVKVYRTQNGREIELAIVGKGSVLGEMALIDGRPRSASAVALDICVAIMVDAESFHTRVKGVPAWLMTIVKMTSKKIRNADRLLQSIGGSRCGINIILALNYFFSRFGEKVDLVLVRQFLVRLLKAPDEGIVRIIDFLCQQKFLACGETELTLLEKVRFAEYCDFLRLYLQKTFERAVVPSARVQEFIMTVAREIPETVAIDNKRPPMVELAPEKVRALLEKANGADARNEILADCGELSLCKVLKTEKNGEPVNEEQSGEHQDAATLQLATALWRQWYLYFLYNGVIPCM
jgi:CRP/FNR family transcriptional regulator, cyclic AMP receptor protein